jgi:hypothetical protein
VIRNLAWFITLVSIIICLSSPVVAVLAGESKIAISHIYRYPDGSSVGVYLNDPAHDTVGARLVIRRRGFASIEGDTAYEPISLAFFVIPPVFFVLWHHYRPLAPRGQRLLPWCAASPFALTLMMIYVRKLDRMSLAVGVLSLAVALVIGILQAMRRRIRKRIERGLCPNCGYDLRATPDGGGAVLSRCPECGSDNYIAQLAAARERAG